MTAPTPYRGSWERELIKNRTTDKQIQDAKKPKRDLGTELIKLEVITNNSRRQKPPLGGWGSYQL